MMRCGLIGETLSHSFSAQIHEMLHAYSYELFELAPTQLARFLKEGDWRGLNVTIPYKRAVIPYCDTLSDTARRIGSVNTILRDASGRLQGYNTDYDGFCAMADASDIPFSGKKVLVLGSGGAGKTAGTAAADLGAASVVTVSRTGDVNYQTVHALHADAEWIVNATPIGMSPGNGVSPLSLDGFPALEGVVDLIYNPLRTALLLDASDRGLIAVNGLRMLVTQAIRAAELFLNRAIAAEMTEILYNRILWMRQNIVLIGMPGCGKSEIAQRLARQIGRPWLDTDRMVEEETGQSIPELFAQKGESAFRAAEMRAVARAGACTGTVIATGGGVPMSEQNRRALRQNGSIVFLRRDSELLARDGRPLSADSEMLAALARYRMPFYRAYGDCEIDNNKTPQETISAILAVCGMKE